MTRAGLSISRRSRDGGATRPKKIPWMAAAIAAGRWSSVSSTTRPQWPTNRRGTRRAARAVEDRHLDEQPLDTVSGDRRDLEGHVGTERRAPDHRGLHPEVVEQVHDL